MEAAVVRFSYTGLRLTKTFTHSKELRVAVYSFMGLGLGGMILVMVVKGNFTLDALSGLLFMLALCGLAARELESRVVLDDEKITHQSLLSSTSMKWSQVSDVHDSAHLLSIVSIDLKKRININAAEFGGFSLALEPSEVLKQEVLRRTLPLLSEKWERLIFPLTYAYATSTRGILLVYLIPLILVLIFFILFVTRTEGMVLEKMVFLALGLLAIVPFWIRDHRASRKKLILTQDGLKQVNGDDIVIPWNEIANCSFTEEPLGLGSVLIRSRAHKCIKLPRSLPSCGQILYFIERECSVRVSGRSGA
jgi:hypothetical protein